MSKFSIKMPSHATAFNPYINVVYRVINQKRCLSSTTNGRPIWKAHNTNDDWSSSVTSRHFFGSCVPEVKLGGENTTSLPCGLQSQISTVLVGFPRGQKLEGSFPFRLHTDY